MLAPHTKAPCAHRSFTGFPDSPRPWSPGWLLLFSPARVPAGTVFVLGDNRGDSEDSREFGAIPNGDLIGRVDLTIPPLSDLF
jgi:signal peptidase I